MKQILISIISVVIFSLSVKAQQGRICNDFDFSPQAFSMITNGDVQPDLNTGTLNISIPIFVWEDQDFKIPIELHYTTNGFKPARQTGVVGMGWSCPMGGVITRQIVGVDDFNDSYGYYNKPHTNYTNENLYKLNTAFYFDADNNVTMIDEHETNPDVFHFNFLGYSGSFVIDDDGSFKVFNSNGERGCYSITYIGGSSKKFMIETGDGYIYHFGSASGSKEYLYLYNPAYLTFNGKYSVYLSTSDLSIIAWHLDEIVAPNGRKISFHYSSQYQYSAVPNESDKVCTTFSSGYFEIPNDINPQSKISTHKYPSITTVSYLDSISFRPSASSRQTIVSLKYTPKDHVEVEDADDNRYAMLVTRQQKLDEVTYYDHYNRKIGNLSLSYTYKNTRMLLDHIRISDVGCYKFTYDTSRFMPGILTNAQDLWGFYNGVYSADSHGSPTSLDSHYNELVTKTFMNPNASYSKAGTLKSIVYPTGGRTEFEYESNTASQILLRTHAPSENNLDPFIPSLKDFDDTFDFQGCGGVRIKSIADYSDTTCVYRRTYSYNIPGTSISSGIVLKFNRFYSEKMPNGEAWYNPYYKFPDNSFDKLHMAYSYVTEHFSDGSYKVYGFTDYQMYPDEYSPYNKDMGYYVEYTSNAYETFVTNIMREPDSRHYRRGLIRAIEEYDDNGVLKHRKEYTYADSDASYITYIVGSGNYWWSARRFTCDYLLKKITETQYRENEMTTVLQFEHNALGLKTRERILDKKLEYGRGKYYGYCYENSTSTGYNLYRRTISDIVQTTFRKGKEYVTGNLELTYDSETANTNPIQVKEYSIDAPVAVGNLLHRPILLKLGRTSPYTTTSYIYNTLFRLTKVQKEGDSYESYSWDAGMHHITRKVINNPQHYFTYAWKDMVGVTKVTDPFKLSETYQYDSKNRLEKVIDSQGKTTTQYFYHINNE